MTQELQQDGSIIYYMHNKATMAESNIIWKLTAEAFAVSIDGGKTYPYGFAVTGELITRLLYAEGINADYINAGTLIVRDKSGNAIFEADMDTGSVTIDGSCVTIGGKPLDAKIEDVENMAALARNMTMQLDNDYQGIPVDSDGNYTEFPECTTTATVMYGTQDITDNCTYTITTSQNIQGHWNKENKTYTVTGLTADSGWVNIKAAYLNNLVVSKQFSLAKQYAGKDGANGIPGKDGKDGKTQYTHLAYANSADGKTDFSVSDGNREYIGMYVDFVEADSTDPAKYTWVERLSGADGAQGDGNREHRERTERLINRTSTSHMQTVRMVEQVSPWMIASINCISGSIPITHRMTALTRQNTVGRKSKASREMPEGLTSSRVMQMCY